MVVTPFAQPIHSRTFVHPWQLRQHPFPRHDSTFVVNIYLTGMADQFFYDAVVKTSDSVDTKDNEAATNMGEMKTVGWYQLLGQRIKHEGVVRVRRVAERTLLIREEELRIAKEIQQQLFPASSPTNACYDMAGASCPARRKWSRGQTPPEKAVATIPC